MSEHNKVSNPLEEYDQFGAFTYILMNIAANLCGEYCLEKGLCAVLLQNHVVWGEHVTEPKQVG